MTKSEAIAHLNDLREAAKQRPVPSPAQVAGLITRLCEQEQATFAEYMKRKAFIESRFNPLAMNKASSASGLFQIMPFNCIREWEQNPQFDPFNAGHNILWTIRFTEDNIDILDARGFKITLGVLYLAHQQGAGGATTILRGAAKGLTIAQLPDDTERNVRANIPSGVRIITCQQFVDLWENRMRSAVVPTESLAALDGEEDDDENSLA